MSVADYIGRMTDLCVLNGAAQAGQQLLPQALAPGSICAGTQKLAQMVAICLLTDRGSVYGQPARGTDFMTALRSGGVQTVADVGVLFGSAALDISNQLNDAQPSDAPDDERLDSLTLDSAALLGDYLQLTIRITSRAGDARAVLLPLQIPLNS